MTISWVNSDGKDGIAENEYEFAMQHQEKTPEPEQTPFDQAHEEMNLNQQEKDLYQRHLGNLYGTGGVDNPDGSRSSLYNLGVEHEGRTYNVPSVYEGKILPPREAVDKAFNAGIGRFPSYPTREEAEKRYSRMHDFMEMDTKNYQEQRSKMSPQERINESFSQIPKRRYDDQNNPAVWGLDEVNQNIDSMMEDPGPKLRQENIQQELDSGQQRTPLEHQAQVKQDSLLPNLNMPFEDQNRPLEYGLESVLERSQDMMKAPGRWGEDPNKIIKENEQKEIDYHKKWIPSERQASLEQQLGDPSKIPTSAYQQFADYVHDLRVKFTGEPDKWSGKEVVGDFLDKAMSVMGGGIRRPPGGSRGGLGRGLTSSIGEERIQSAAMKVGDKIYEGENHGIAYEKAGDHHPAAVVEEGFTTSKGRFISREEAAQIAKKQEQVLLEARQTENLHSGELKYGFERVPQSEQEPPLKKGFTRLYRAETSTLPGEKPGPVSDWVAESPEYKATLESTGRWFTNSKEAAQWYVDKMGGKHISHVDVPTKDVAGYNVANNPEAKKFTAEGRANEEFFLPSELASTRKPLITPPKEPSKAQWTEYEKLSSQGKTTKQILKATKMDPEVVRDALGRDNLALAAFNSENALTEAYFNQLKTMPPELEKALRAKGVSVKDLKSFTRSLPEEDLAQIFQKLPENVKTWWQAGELRRQKIDEGKKASMIPKGSKPLKE